MRIAVFGGSGFIGSNLTQRLLADGHFLNIFDHQSTSTTNWAPHPQVKRFFGDFRVMRDFSEVVENCDAVFHLISTALPSTSSKNTLNDVQENLVPTIRLAESMNACGVSKLIFPSSGGTVYGQAQQIPITEKHPTEPIVSYGATKLAIEKYLYVYRQESPLRPICLRITNPYGPGFRPDSPQGAVGAFLYRALKNLPIEIWGKGDTRRDYLYIGDLIGALTSTLNYSGDEHVINISTGIGTTLLELIEHIELVLNRRLHVQFRDTRSFDVQSNVLSNNLAKSELNWTPSVDLVGGIRTTSAWLKNQLQLT
jgi:UDP-glucose 4-epimerase